MCDWSGSWNKLAKELGLLEFNSSEYSNTYTDKSIQLDPIGRLRGRRDSVFSQEEEGSLPRGIAPWEQAEWRGLKNSFLSKIPTYRWNQSIVTRHGRQFYVERALWPYYQFGTLRGYVGRRLDKEKFQKYYRASWTEAKKVLFPFDYVRGRFREGKPLVLVEGEVDALNLLQAGIPALSILGSNNWCETKRDTVLSLDPGIIFLLMDPDQAGRHASAKISSTLRRVVPYKALTLSPGDDPGSMDKDQLLWLKNRVYRGLS